MNDYGIDYGMGTTNVSPSGIRFGVIPMRALDEWAWESLEADYGEPSCPRCGNGVGFFDDLEDDSGFESLHKHSCSDYFCAECKLLLDSQDCFSEEALGWSLDDGEYRGVMGSDGIDLFVTDSPYYTFAQYCSPCAPGACYLLSPVDEGGPKCFCLGHDWFEGEKAPYPVYRVDDNSLVEPEGEEEDEN